MKTSFILSVTLILNNINITYFLILLARYPRIRGINRNKHNTHIFEIILRKKFQLNVNQGSCYKLNETKNVLLNKIYIITKKY